MKRTYVLLGLAFLLVVCRMTALSRRKAAEEPQKLPALSCSVLKNGDQDLSWKAGSDERAVRMYRPASIPRDKPAPLVIVLHGGGQKGGQAIEGMARMNPTADANGFLVAYPTGSVRGKWGGYTWNGGDCCGEAMKAHKDDVGAIGDLIDVLTAGGCVDPKRVYATGVSNGGIMAYHLACDLSDKIAAAAPIAASLMDDTCTPDRPVSMYVMHGTADTFVHFEGGQSWKKSGAARPFVSVRESVDTWLKIDHCKGAPKQTYHKGDTTCTTHDECAHGSAVTLCTIEGGGHSWPGGDAKGRIMLNILIGKTTQDIGNQQMWDFFDKHPMP